MTGRQPLSVGPGRLTAGLDRYPRLDLRAHLAVHGPMPALTLTELVALAEVLHLRGRGGAGFPVARKLTAVARSAQRRGCRIAVVVNASEGEPASHKDKMLLLRAPHLVLDGASLAARALGASSIAIGIAENEPGTDSLIRALGDRGYEHAMSAPSTVVTVPSRFISGEGGALVRAVNGETPIPPGRKRLASDRGVQGLPTFLSNAETYAQLAIAARLGPRRFASVGSRAEPGTLLLTVTGDSGHPTVVETPSGVRLCDVLDLCGVDAAQGALVGGFHGTWLGPDAVGTAHLSRDGLAAVGGTLGAGVILALGAGTCPLGETSRVAQYLAAESAGQCGPCLRGLPELAHWMAALAAGIGGRAVVDAIEAAAAAVRGRGACAHPDGSARFALSALDAFAADVAVHVSRGACGRPVRGVLPVPAGARAATLTVDWTRCDAHGLCAHIVPELITLDANGYPGMHEHPVPAWLQTSARKAVDMCPALALRLRPSP